MTTIRILLSIIAISFICVDMSSLAAAPRAVHIVVIRQVSPDGEMHAAVCREGRDICNLPFSVGSGAAKLDVTARLHFEIGAACFKFVSGQKFLVADGQANFCLLLDSHQIVSLSPAMPGERPGNLAQPPVIKGHRTPIAEIEIAMFPLRPSDTGRSGAGHDDGQL